MNSITYAGTSKRTCHTRFSIGILAAVAALGIGSALLPLAAHAQSTTATIFGNAPAGESVTASSSSGLHRHGKANASGRYTINSLPAGSYTVTLEKDGQAVDTRSNIALIVGRGIEVDFACPNDHCAAADR